MSEGKRDRWACAKLWLRVNADAFRYDPAGYLQAVGWRVRRLRLRSRNRMAALAGRSPFAYAYWMACIEPGLAAPARPDGSEPEVICVIDCSRGRGGLDRTLASLPHAQGALVIGREGDPAPAAALKPVVEDGPRWLCIIECGDTLAPDALPVYRAAAAKAGEARLVYADDDLIDEDGRRREPHFKPDWNPELFDNHDYLGGSCIVQVRSADLDELPAKAWAEALLARALAKAKPPVHVHRLLHHRRSRPEPVVPAKPLDVVPQPAPLVSVIIPTRNAASLLAECLKGVAEANYPATEMIVVDNGSDEPDALELLRSAAEQGAKIVTAPGPFNYSVLNNRAVREATGDILCFLNNDVEMTDPDWLALLVRQAVREDIGAVGARLLYPDGTVQHAGVFTGIGGGAAHAHRLERPGEEGYFLRSRLPQRVSAVTGACLVVASEKFTTVGGFDEENFPVAFNDVDLCLKLNARGWQSFYEPRATLIHHESKSRGSDRLKANRARFADELAALKRKWGTDQRPDPYHHPHLSPFTEQFLIGV